MITKEVLQRSEGRKGRKKGGREGVEGREKRRERENRKWIRTQGYKPSRPAPVIHFLQQTCSSS